MAIIKFIGPIHPHKGSGGKFAGLGAALRYISNKKKTVVNGIEYLGSQHCFPETALKEMAGTAAEYGKEPRKARDRVGYHFTISWKPEENVTPEQALRIAKEFCEKYLSGYEAVYSVHMDQEHMHSHIVFNSVNAMTGYKYRYENRDWERKVQPIVDMLCEKEGLHRLEEDTGIPLPEYDSERAGRRKRRNKNESGKQRRHSNNRYEKEDFTNKDAIRFDIDQAIAEADDLQEFRKLMEEKYGYRVRTGKSEKYGTYTAFWTAGMERWRRNYALGGDYTDEAISRRIEIKKKELPRYEEKQQEEIFIFPAKVYRIRIRRYPQDPFLRKKYAELYRMGILPKYKKPLSYKEKRMRLKEIRNLEEELEVLSKVDISDPDILKKQIEKEEEVESAIQDKIENFRKKSWDYLKMLKKYRLLEKMEQQAKNGEIPEDDPQLLGQRALCSIQPFSYEELNKWEQSYKAKLREMKQQKKEQEKKLAVLKKAAEEYRNENMEEDVMEEEMLQHMDEKYEMNEKERKK